MKTIYIAYDGTQFNDEYACEDYEWKLDHPHLKDVHIFDKDGSEFEDIFSEDTYSYSDKIVVTSIEAVNDLQELSIYTGYCCYKSIDKVGTWKYDEEKERFVMI